MKTKKCFCGKKMEITEIDRAEKIAWVACPEFMLGNDAHESYSIVLTKKVENEFLAEN